MCAMQAPLISTAGAVLLYSIAVGLAGIFLWGWEARAMGAGSPVGHSSPHNQVLMYFRGVGRGEQDANDIMQAWFEDGAPLGLTTDMFEQVLGVSNRADLFQAFDTDQNRKVDAFEVLSALIVLGTPGTAEAKVETLFPVFDFSGSGQLNFDEANILLQSVAHGVRKAYGEPTLSDGQLVEICHAMFDMHNLPYDKQITKEQVRRWVCNDADAVKFMSAVESTYTIQDLEAALRQAEQAQVAAFQAQAGAAGPEESEVPLEHLFCSKSLRKALGTNSDEEVQALLTMAAGPGGNSISLGRFCQVLHGWNAFALVDASGIGEVSAEELPLLLRLRLAGSQGDSNAVHGGDSPDQEDSVVRAQLAHTGDRISKSAWLKAIGAAVTTGD